MHLQEHFLILPSFEITNSSSKPTMKAPIFFSVITFCLFLQPNPSLYAAVDYHFEACRNPKTCGRQSISFPFYIDGLQQPYCGYPGFAITCSDDRPLLNLSNTNYLIHDVVYPTQSLRVSNAAVSDPASLCSTSPASLRNLTLNPVLFQLYRNVTTLYLLYNCRPNISSADLSRYGIGCSGAESVVLGLTEGDSGEGDAFRACDSVVEVPVEARGNGSRREIGDVIGDGFVMTWTASNCSRCEKSGGRCGFDRESFHFTCFCPDRPHGCCCISAAKGKWKLVLVAAAVGGTILTTLAASIFIKRNRSSKGHQDMENFIRNYGSLTPKRFKYSEVKKMTNSFKEKLGQGGFGAVYKGKLLGDETLVAVKLLHELKGNGEDFINEVASISRTSHVNIVTLLGFCLEGSKRALIYEYMSNQSLDKFICVESPERNLGWEKLHQIAVGIARGLEYLHRGCNTRILHFDIKPQNILLDDDFCPKISDFGLSKLCLKKESILSTMTTRGTIGYIAPEVFSRNFGGVSHKSDVYSYGMMLIDMVGGRRKLKEEERDQSSKIYFPDPVYRLLEQDNINALGLDGSLTPEENEICRKMVAVGLWCIQTIQSHRPSMSRVIELLEGSIETLQMPPKPYLFSPSRSLAQESFSTLESL